MINTDINYSTFWAGERSHESETPPSLSLNHAPAEIPVEALIKSVPTPLIYYAPAL